VRICTPICGIHIPHPVSYAHSTISHPPMRFVFLLCRHIYYRKRWAAVPISHIFCIDILGVSFCSAVKIFWKYEGKYAHSQVSKEQKLNCFCDNNFTSAVWILSNI
jgi:hypothetical protein